MKDHVQKVCKTCYYHLRQLRSIRGSLSADSSSALVRAFISSRLDYCNSLLTGIDKSQVNKLQSILRVAARLVMRKGKFESISRDIRDKLHWLPIQQRIKFKIGVLGLQVHPWNSPAIPIGDAQRSCGHCRPTIPPICRAWGPRCPTFQDGQIRLPNVRCFGSNLLELVDERTQKFQFN